MIHILLSTYNGGQYLAAMLDSLLAQDFAAWKLFVRDDGSSDNTLSILAQYQSAFGEKMTILPADGKRLGAMRSFEHLLQAHGAGAYVMFADQDDVWMPRKLLLTWEKMQAVELQYPGSAITVFTDAYIVDKDLQPSGHTYFEFNRMKQPYATRFNYVSVANPAAGCTMMLNPEARALVLPFANSVPVHDWWIAALVAREGKLIPLTQPTLYYRQHDNNQYGTHVVTGKHYWNRLLHLPAMLREFRALAPFLDDIGFGSVGKYIWYKTLYFFLRRM